MITKNRNKYGGIPTNEDHNIHVSTSDNGVDLHTDSGNETTFIFWSEFDCVIDLF